MNFTALVTKIRREIGGRTDLDALVSGSSNTDIEDATNDAIKAVSLWYPYDFDSVVFTTLTTQSQQTYLVPANLVDIENIRHQGTSATDQGEKLQYFHPNHFDDVIPNPQHLLAFDSATVQKEIEKIGFKRDHTNQFVWERL